MQHTDTGVGLGVFEGMLGPTFLLMPGQACLPRSGVPHDSPFVGHLLWYFASTALGPANSSVFYWILQQTDQQGACKRR